MCFAQPGRWVAGSHLSQAHPIYQVAQAEVLSRAHLDLEYMLSLMDCPFVSICSKMRL